MDNISKCRALIGWKQRGLSLEAMSQFFCSIAVYCTSACDVSTRYPDRTQFFSLISCVNDVKAHLRGLQTTQLCVASKRELILARVGLFDEKGEEL